MDLVQGVISRKTNHHILTRYDGFLCIISINMINNVVISFSHAPAPFLRKEGQGPPLLGQREAFSHQGGTFFFLFLVARSLPS